MDDLKSFNNEELLELYQKIDDEIKLLNSNIINENTEEEEETKDDKS